MKDLTDYDLLMKIREIKDLEKNKVYREELYYRCELFIKKYAYKYARSRAISNNYYHEFNDHMSDSYLYFEEAITKFNPDKVYDQENFKFVGFLDFYLRRNSRVKRIKACKSFSLCNTYPSAKSRKEQDSDEDSRKSYSKIDRARVSKKRSKRIYSVSSIERDLPYNDDFILFEDEYIQKFYDKLTPRQIKILNFRKEGLSLSKIAKSLKVSYASVHRDLGFCERDFNTHFDTNFNVVHHR